MNTKPVRITSPEPISAIASTWPVTPSTSAAHALPSSTSAAADPYTAMRALLVIR